MGMVSLRGESILVQNLVFTCGVVYTEALVEPLISSKVAKEGIM